MSDETWIPHRVDQRSGLTNAINPELLAQMADSWAVPPSLPPAAAQLWKRACAQFGSGTIAYENFTDAVRTGFEAVDSTLRHQVRDLLIEGKVVTFGGLVRVAYQDGRLTAHQHQWLSTYALRFRNRLTHPDLEEPLVLTPPMAAEMLAGIARFLVDLTETTTQQHRGSFGTA